MELGKVEPEILSAKMHIDHRDVGQLTLRNLRLKKGALDKFRLPVDVLEGMCEVLLLSVTDRISSGHLGKFTLSLHWMNLGNQPVEVLIEDVYLLVVPSPQTNINPDEEEQRAQAAKAERLENAELLHMRGQAEIDVGMTQRYSCGRIPAEVDMLQIIQNKLKDYGRH
jgi:vacuolar protein sorting-associated protein 13A/C